MSARARGRPFSPEVPGGDLLALRPVNALHALRRAGADREACPLSLTWIARSLAASRATLPIACAPIPAVARAVLVAAHEAGAVVGLSPLPGAAPEAWFASVARAADELAPRLPIFLSAEVSVGEAVEDLPRACAAAHRLVEAGITHLAIDVTQVPLARRSQAAAEVAVPAAERELAVDCVLPADCGRDPEVAAAFLEEFEGWGARADLVSLRLAAAGSAAEARRQGAALDAVAAACAGRPVVRRGPLAGRTLSALRGAALRLSADGGRTLAAGLRGLPRGPRAAGRGSRGVVELSAATAARVEALAYAEAASLIERLGAAGTARALRGAPR
jgi:hypothetical protein